LDTNHGEISHWRLAKTTSTPAKGQSTRR
jgi:hypothetical protein